MMHSEALVWLTTGIGGPLSVVWLCWAILVLWFGRGQWRPSDPLLIALLAEAIAKQAAGTAGSALSLFRPDEPALCSAVQWLWTAAHTMQAGTLASLALMAGLRRKKRTVAAGGRPLLLYHLASLSVVSACVGAAALIAQTDPCSPPSDRRYAVFSLVLHASLALVAAASAAFGCAGHRKGPNPLLVNSSSDLSSCMSEISTVSSCSRGGIRHSVSDCSDRTTVTCTTSATAGGYRLGGADCTGGGGLVHDLLRLPSAGSAPPVTFLNGAPRALHANAEDDTLRRLDETKRLIDSGTLMAGGGGDRDSYAASTIRPYRYGCGVGGHGSSSRYLPSTAASVSVSSTNSRAPCLAKRVSLVQDVRIGYVVAILFMCYFVDHLPVLVLMASEHFIPSKFVILADYAPIVKNFPMLAALAEACLWPVVLLLFDDQFVPRLSNLYRRRSASERAKPPQGLHGKFRPYNGSLQDARRPTQTSNSGGGGNGEAVRFPITNGSLFTSLDGRVPVLHNYRRGVRTMSGLLVPPLPPHFIHSATDPTAGHCCDDEHHHHQHHHHHQQQQQHHRSLRFANMVTASATMSSIGVDDCKAMADDSSTPADSLDDAIIMATGGVGRVAADNRLPQNLQQLREKLYAQDDDDDDEDDSGRGGRVDDDDDDDGRASCCGVGADDGLDAAAVVVADDDDSSDDGCERRDDCEDEDEEGEYATLSARSVCSATTAANDDFEYFAAAADRPVAGDGGGAVTAATDSGPPPAQPTIAGVQHAASPSHVGGRVPYQRAPTRRAKHHQQLQQQQHQHHHHHHHQPQYHHHQPQQQHHHHHKQVRATSTPQPALPPTPPTPRRTKARLTTVLSVDSLVAAQAAADAATTAARYPRGTAAAVQPHQHQNHHHGGRHRGGFGGIAGRRLGGGGGGRGHHGGSVPDLKRVFVTDFL